MTIVLFQFLYDIPVIFQVRITVNNDRKKKYKEDMIEDLSIKYLLG